MCWITIRMDYYCKKGTVQSVVIVAILVAAVGAPTPTGACRVNSELLKSYARRTSERLLNVEHFGSIYWQDEPLPSGSLSKSTGINITLAETHFGLEPTSAKERNELAPTGEERANEDEPARGHQSLIQDIFVTCSVDRDRSYALTINLELENPFKVIDVYYDAARRDKRAAGRTGAQQVDQQAGMRAAGLFRVHLPDSSLLVQLSQRIRYDECLTVNYVQLSPTVNYEIECVDCDEREQTKLDKIFSKRMSQLDAELDAILSEKALFGLQVLLNQQRLDLDMYLD